MTGESGVPYLEDVQRSRRRWQIGGTLGAVAAIAAVVVLIIVIANMASALKVRNGAVIYIKQLTDQQVCVDEIEGEWEEALSNVVLAGFDREAGRKIDAPSLERAIRRSLAKLEAVAAGRLCPLPDPPKNVPIGQADEIVHLILVGDD